VPSSVDFTFNGYYMKKTKVRGRITAKKLRETCEADDKWPVCDHTYYYDGKCITVGGRWHFSHPTHDRQHKISVGRMQNTYLYTGRHHTGALQNTGRGHRWVNGGDNGGYTWCAERKYGWQFLEYPFGNKLHRVKVEGRMTRKAILKACRAKDKLPVCDHAHYYDTYCEKLGGRWHFSYPIHDKQHGIKVRTVEGLFFYTGPHGTGALQNLRTTHRWANAHHDQDGTTVCSKRQTHISAFNFHYQNLKIERTIVEGDMTAANILKACEAKGLAPVCDHSHYNDGKCRAFGNWHFSYPPHARRRGINATKLTGAFFYTGHHHVGSLQNTGRSHRWRSSQDAHMDTFCSAKPPKPPNFSYLAYNMTRVAVKGVMSAKNIRIACKRHGKLAPVCDHVAYYDGKCVAANAGSRWHFSYPHHDKQHGIYYKTLKNSYFYTGIHHTGSLQNTGRTHRWNRNNKNGNTYCAKPPEPWDEMKFKGHKLYRVQVGSSSETSSQPSKRMDRMGILEACRAKGMLPVCDHDHYYDGYCVKRGGRWHFSYPRHASKQGVELEKIQGMFFYTGQHGSGALQNVIHTHRWSNHRDYDGFTLCGKRHTPLHAFTFFYEGRMFHRVMVEGHMSAANILKACHAQGLGPVLDHWHYMDGKAQGYGNWHFSYPPHCRSHRVDTTKVIGAFFYTGRHHTGSLQNTGRSHRWRNHKDGFMDTFCTSKPPKGPNFAFGPFLNVRTRVKGRMNRANLREACRKKGKAPVVFYKHSKAALGDIKLAGSRNIKRTSNGNGDIRSGNPGETTTMTLPKTIKVPRGAMVVIYYKYVVGYGCDGKAGGPTMQFTIGKTKVGPKIGPLTDYPHDHCNGVGGKTGYSPVRKWREEITKGATGKFKVTFKNHKRNMHLVIEKVVVRTAEWKPICDHRYYYDGRCIPVGGNWHFSYPWHDRAHGIWYGDLTNAFFYTGHHHTGSLMNTGRSHRWSNGHDVSKKHRWKDTYCSKSPPGMTHFTFKGRRVIRVEIEGRVNRQSILKACRNANDDYLPICDHDHYYDGYCEKIGGRWHFSYPHHTRRQGIELLKVQGIYFYTGPHGSGALQNIIRTHRWANHRDVGGETMCVKRKKPVNKMSFKFQNMDMVRVRVKGVMDKKNIRAACNRKGLGPVVDHWYYNDGLGRIFGGWHFSHPHHNRRHGVPLDKVVGAFFYTGDHHTGSLQNTGRSHRWRNSRDAEMDTFCTKKPPKGPNFSFQNFQLIQTKVKGRPDAKNIFKACKEDGMYPVCDHTHYYDGKCIMVGGRWHFSYPHHDRSHGIPVPFVKGSFFYTGRHHVGSLMNTGRTHRWRRGSDKDKTTYCTKRPSSWDNMKYNGVSFKRVLVPGQPTASNILKTCRKLEMLPVCDHTHYYDGYCNKNGGRWHFSYPHHDRQHGIDVNKVAGVFFYTGRHGHGSLMNTGRSHRWRHHRDNNMFTMCTPVKAKLSWFTFKFGGLTFKRVYVKGTMNAKNIRSACEAKGLAPVVDHWYYADGIGRGFGRWHFSYPPHCRSHGVPRDKTIGAFFYTAGHHTGSLQNTGRSHRWRNGRDAYMDTFCTKKPKPAPTVTIGGMEMYRVKVNPKFPKYSWSSFHKKYCPGNLLKKIDNKKKAKDTFVKICEAACSASSKCMGFVLHYKDNKKQNRPDNCRLKKKCDYKIFAKAGTAKPKSSTEGFTQPTGGSHFDDETVGGVATQSSEGWSGRPSRAVDGNTNQGYGGGSCTHTGHHAGWWRLDFAMKFSSATQSGNMHGHHGHHYGAHRAIDNHFGTRNGISGSWTGDLGTVQHISSVSVSWEACQCRSGHSLLVDVSTDGKHWKRFAKWGGFHQWGGRTTRTVHGSAQNARFVRISGTGHMNNRWMSFWEVWVGRARHIAKVKVWNRSDCCRGRLNGVRVKVDNSQCGTLSSTTNVQTINCNKKGSYLKIEMPRRDYLTLCEVKIFAKGSPKVIHTNQGNYYVDTKQTFRRPADVTVMMKQVGDSNNPECGVISVFPQRHSRHSGYNAGIGWWRHYFGAGINGHIRHYGKNNGATNVWHTVRINVAADGMVYYYLDGQLRHKVADNRYQEGKVRLGFNCRAYEYKDLKVHEPEGIPLGDRDVYVKSPTGAVRGLHLQSGWRGYGHGYAAPTTTKLGHVCVVSGLIRRRGMRNPLATLPSDCRPKKRLIFNVNNHQFTLRLDVLTNGQIHFVAGHWHHGWLNLDGIQFATGAHKNLPYASRWRAYGHGYGGATYSKQGPICVVEGLIKHGHWRHPMVILPKDCRPKKRLIFNQNNHRRTARVDVQTNGKVTWHAGGHSHHWISLGGMMFATDEGRALPLRTHWQAYGHGYGNTISVTKVGKLCLVSGLLRGRYWGHSMAVLPNDCRPSGRLIFNMNNHQYTARVDVLPDGRIFWQGGGHHHGWVSVSGMTVHTAQGGVMDRPNIRKACEEKKMYPVCDHTAYYDGICLMLGGWWHFSYPGHDRHHGIPVPSVKGAFFYTGPHGTGALLNTGRTHRWARSHDIKKDTYCAKRPSAWNNLVYNGVKFHRTKVSGKMTRGNILKACRDKGLLPVCDHSHYYDGYCNKEGGHWHFSHPHHNRQRKIDVNKAAGIFWYTGYHHVGALMNTGRSHRWSSTRDTDSYTMCTKPKKGTHAALEGKKFKYMGMTMTRVKVKGPMDAPHIREACAAKNLGPLVDHLHYASDGKGRGYGWWHFSYHGHARRHGIPLHLVTGAFFYTGNHHTGSLENTGRSHRWAVRGRDSNMDTFCTTRPLSPPNLAYGIFDMFRTKVQGHMNAANIRKACKKHSEKGKELVPICDHNHYFDGMCLMAGGWWHFSYPRHARHHGVPVHLARHIFWYTGPHHTGSLYNTGHTHRWRRHNDRNGYTMCGKRPSSWNNMVYKGVKFHRTKVSGRMTAGNILKACRAKSLLPVCDHTHYYDGYCNKEGGRWHFSYPHHDRARGIDLNKVAGIYFYTGPHGHGSLFNTGRSHRWSRHNDRDAYTMCTKPKNRMKMQFEWQGMKFHRVTVKGHMNSQNIHKACKDKGLGPVMDHRHYSYHHKGIGRGFGWFHFSYPPHCKQHGVPRSAVIGAFFSTGHHHTGSLQNTGYSHRWRNGNDENMDTFCVKKPIEAPHFSMGAVDLYRTKFHGAASAANLRKACAARGDGYMPVCDHSHYYDGKCFIAGGSWHFSYPGHNRHFGVPVHLARYAFWYTGPHHVGSLYNTGHTHRWRHGGHHWGHPYTFCAKLPSVYHNPKYRGVTMKRVTGSGAPTAANIRKLCKAKSLVPVCDHTHYYDGYCSKVGGHWHFSYPPHDRHHGLFPNQFAGVAFYTGPHHTGSLINLVNTHRWRNGREHNTITMCASPRGISTGSFRFRGKHLHRVRVKGKMSRGNIMKACKDRGLMPVCDHTHYWYHGHRDCAPFGWWHFSYPGHDRRHGVPVHKVVGAFFYTSNHHTGSLLNTGHTHRWANGHDYDMDTYCTSAPAVDVARGRHTQQSSEGWSGRPSRAVDGNARQHYGHNSCTHTGHHRAWWQVNLGRNYAVEKVKIWNRSDCCRNRLRGAQVRVGNKYCGAYPDGRTYYEMSCNAKTGSSVRISLPRNDYLTLCEVQVIAKPV
jgi:hypothetical protein